MQRKADFTTVLVENSETARTAESTNGRLAVILDPLDLPADMIDRLAEIYQLALTRHSEHAAQPHNQQDRGVSNE